VPLILAFLFADLRNTLKIAICDPLFLRSHQGHEVREIKGTAKIWVYSIM